MKKRLRVYVDDDLAEQIRKAAGLLEMSDSQLSYKLLQSCFTQQHHFLHTVKELLKDE